MSGELVVLLSGREAGVVTQSSRGELGFSYSDGWRESEAGYPLSISMPLVQREHGDPVIRPYMEGLLPDSDRVLEMWGRQFGVSARNLFGLLRHVGEDVAGAVQFIPRERFEELSTRPGTVEWLTEVEVGHRLDRLLRDQSAGRLAGDVGYFSLAGAQPKTALLWDGERWGIPSGRIPTTHILKPPALDLEGLAWNEHLCLRLAGTLGLPAVNSEVKRFGDQIAIVVERYDRAYVDGELVRVHQEDFCQAAAVSPRIKYEAEGGPGAGTIVRRLEEHSSDADADVDTFVCSLALHWATGAPDAHAKNYSILIAPGAQARLAPLYDLLSVLPYPDRFFARKLKLAMRIGGEYRLGYIRGRHWDRFAERSGLDAERVRALVYDVVSRVPDCLAQLCADARDDGVPDGFLSRFQDSISRHAMHCRTLLERPKRKRHSQSCPGGGGSVPLVMGSPRRTTPT